MPYSEYWHIQKPRYIQDSAYFGLFRTLYNARILRTLPFSELNHIQNFGIFRTRSVFKNPVYLGTFRRIQTYSVMIVKLILTLFFPLQSYIFRILAYLEVQNSFKAYFGIFRTLYNAVILRERCYIQNLKLVSAIFYQIFIFSPNDSPLKTMKNACFI